MTLISAVVSADKSVQTLALPADSEERVFGNRFRLLREGLGLPGKDFVCDRFVDKTGTLYGTAIARRGRQFTNEIKLAA